MMFKKSKYPINKEFFPYSMFTPPISDKFTAFARMGMKVPGFFRKDKEAEVISRFIPGYKGQEIELFAIKPRNVNGLLPCFIDIHGGGFVLDAGPSHYYMALQYAKGASCIVVFVRYRLAPSYKFPVPQEDCYAAYKWVVENAIELGIDSEHIGIGGDSAGGALAVNVCMMIRDREELPLPKYQLLIYPWLDGRNTSESYKKYTDTPMWNSELSRRVGPMTRESENEIPKEYSSPVEADSFKNLPEAYIEVAEFDCLHDDGVYYAELLKKEGIEVEFHETRGTMHGFDTKYTAPTSKMMVEKRIQYIRKMNAFSSLQK